MPPHVTARRRNIKFLACHGRQKQHGLMAVFCCGSNRETAGCLVRKGQQIAWVQDIYPDEYTRHVQDLRRAGVTVLGQFDTAEEAFAAVEAHCRHAAGSGRAAAS